jgi:hypothetical protein
VERFEALGTNFFAVAAGGAVGVVEAFLVRDFFVAGAAGNVPANKPSTRSSLKIRERFIVT